MEIGNLTERGSAQEEMEELSEITLLTELKE